MPDEIDLANALIDSEVSRRLKEIRASTPTNTTGATHCVECDDLIPVGRQKLGFKICVPCAEDRERKKHLYSD